MRKTLYIVALAVLPLIYLLTGVNFNRTRYSNDPEYAYLLNGVNIANLKSVGHTDNPGTTVQSYSALMLRISHFLRFDVKEELKVDVLSNPDLFIETERIGMIVINALMFLLLGFFTWKYTKNTWFGILLQVTPFLSANLLEHAWTKVSPENFLVLSTGLLSIFILKYYTTTRRDWKYYPWIFAAIAGFGLATKATFLPLLILPLILLEGKKSKWKYLAGIIPAFVFFTIPAVPAYPHMAKWFLGLSTHTGTYGQGGTGIIDPAKYISDFVLIIRNNAALSASVMLTAVLILVLLTRKSLNHWVKDHEALKYIFAIALTQFLGVLMVSKHYHANHYLIPENMLTGLLFLFVVLFVSGLLKEKPPKFISPLPAALAIVLALSSLLNIPYLSAANHGYVITNDEYRNITERLEKEFPGYVKTYYYPTSINPYSALRWGNVYSRTVYTDLLKQIYPGGLFYDTRNGSFQFWETDIPASDFVSIHGKRILLVGGPLTPEEKGRVEAGGLTLEDIYLGRTQAVYKVDTVASTIFGGFRGEPLWTVTCNADSLTSDGKNFVAGGSLILNNWHQNSEAAHSGKFSAKLAGENIYAFEFRIDSAVSGQEYKVSLWKKGGAGKTYLVAASTEAGRYYRQSDAVITPAENGWQRLSLNFSIPAGLRQGVKVYAWNNGTEPVYLDDFTVTRIK